MAWWGWGVDVGLVWVFESSNPNKNIFSQCFVNYIIERPMVYGPCVFSALDIRNHQYSFITELHCFEI